VIAAPIRSPPPGRWATKLTRSASLYRTDLNGVTQLTYLSSFPGLGGVMGAPLYAPDGAQLVVPAARGWALVGNEGKFIRALSVPKFASECWPERWWQAGVVLANCGAAFWLVPVSGAPPRYLAALSGNYDIGGCCDAQSALAGQVGHLRPGHHGRGVRWHHGYRQSPLGLGQRRQRHRPGCRPGYLRQQ
jgi:hypothetical protein